MRRTTLYHMFFWLLLLAGDLHAQNGPLNASSTNIDFGLVPVNTASSQSMVRLASDKAMKVKNVTSRFTSSEWSAKSYFKVVGQIPAVIDTAAAYIGITVTPVLIGVVVSDSLVISYITDSGSSYELIIRMKGTGAGAVPNFTIANGTRLNIVDFGTVPIDSTRDTTIQINNTGNVDLAGILTISGYPTGAFALVHDSTINVKAQSFESFRIRFTPTQGGNHIGGLVLKSAKSGATMDSLPLTGKGYPTAVPGLDTVALRSTANSLDTALNFGVVHRDSCKAAGGYLISFKELPIKIDSVIITGKDARAFTLFGGETGEPYTPDSLHRNQRTDFIIRYCPASVGEHTAAVVFHSGTTTRSMRLSGKGDLPIIEITPPYLVFGGVDSGKSRDLSFTIHNAGEVPATFAPLKFGASGGFSFVLPQPEHVMVKSGDSLPIWIRFSPTTKAIYRDTLMLQSGDSVWMLVLNGSRVPPTDRKVWNAPTVIDFGDVPVDSTREIVANAIYIDQIVPTITINSAALDHPFGDVGFSLGIKSANSLKRGDTLRIPITFKPNAKGVVQDAVTIVPKGDSIFIVRITLKGRGVRGRLIADTSTFKFDDIGIGDVSHATFLVRNEGNSPATLPAGEIVSTDGQDWRAVAFTRTDSNATTPVVVPPGEAVRVEFQFAPVYPGAYHAIWRTGTGSEALSIPLTASATGAYRVWLDNASGKAGDIVSIKAHISPPLLQQMGITGYTARLKVNPLALFPGQATDGPTGSTFSLAPPDSNGMILVKRLLTSPLQGEILFDIDFQGLSSGEARNLVVIDTIWFEKLHDKIEYASGTGTVFLSGCDIGRTAGAAKRAQVSALKVAPGANDATLSFQAAAGAIPHVRIIGASGEQLLAFDLPEATGNQESATIPLRQIPAGLVFIELRVEHDRSTLPVVLMR